MRLPGNDLSRSLTRRRGTTGTPVVPGWDLGSYRAAVTDLQNEIAERIAVEDIRRAETVLVDRLHEPEFVAVLSATPDGVAESVQRLLLELHNYRPNARSSAHNLPALIRIYLLSRIETAWWREIPPYVTNTDLLEATDLVDLDRLQRAGALSFRYRRQATTLPARAGRVAERLLWPDRVPRTAGLRFTRTRPEVVMLLNDIASQFAHRSPRSTPPLWVTSLARSVEHQHRLRSLGYAAMLPSSHCLGYGIDLEMSWMCRRGAGDRLAAVLLDRQRVGDVNLIDEGQAWHLCLSPDAVADLRRDLPVELVG
jgi:hypothetical protein